MENAKAFKRKMLLWTSNWSQEDQQHSTAEVPFTPDAVEIACLLQATGFRVRFMDRCLPKEMHPVPGVPADHPACRVIIMCPGSGVRMELDAPTSSCRCPSPDDSGLGHSWTFNETVNPEMVKAVSSVAPKPSDEISRTVSELIGGVLRLMSMFPDLNHNNVMKNVESRAVSLKSSNQQTQVTTSSTCNRNSPMKTPASGIAIVTPNAPCVPKASPEDSKMVKVGRYRSLDTLIAADGSVIRDDLPEPGQLTPKDEEMKCAGPVTDMEVDGESDTTLYMTVESDINITQGPGSASKKFISKSSPAVNSIENFQRSDTFTFEDEKEQKDAQSKPNKKQKLIRSGTYELPDDKNAEKESSVGDPLPQNTPSPLNQPSTFQSSFMLSKLQEIQIAVSDVIFMIAGNEKNLSNIGDVSKASKAVAGAVQRVISDNTVRPIRCLSDFGSVPNLNRATTAVRSIPRPNTRRYSSAIAAPATPTTSRRGVTNGIDRVKRGSTISSSKQLTTSKKSSSRLAVPVAGNSLQKIDPSPSSTTNETVFTAFSNPRPADNSDKKSTNIQSSIPKPGCNRK